MPTPQQRVINMYKNSLHQLDAKNEVHLLDRYDTTQEGYKKNSRRESRYVFDKILEEKLRKTL